MVKNFLLKNFHKMLIAMTKRLDVLKSYIMMFKYPLVIYLTDFL